MQWFQRFELMLKPLTNEDVHNIFENALNKVQTFLNNTADKTSRNFNQFMIRKIPKIIPLSFNV